VSPAGIRPKEGAVRRLLTVTAILATALVLGPLAGCEDKQPKPKDNLNVQFHEQPSPAGPGAGAPAPAGKPVRNTGSL